MDEFLIHWNNFLQQEYSSYVLMIIGGLLIIFGIMRILGSSIKLLMWVLLVGIGAFSFNYGWDRTTTGQQVSLSDELRELFGPGKDMTLDAMKKMCEKINLSGSGDFGQPE